MSYPFRTLLMAALGWAIAAPVWADAGHSHSAAPFGTPGKALAKARVIKLSMDDTMRFTPASVEVRRGETIRFQIENRGKLRHEMVLGSIGDLKAHAELMQRFPNMQHDEPNMVSVEPGGKAELLWQFSRAGTVDFACLVPGHFEAGMHGKLKVK